MNRLLSDFAILMCYQRIFSGCKASFRPGGHPSEKNPMIFGLNIHKNTRKKTYSFCVENLAPKQYVQHP